MGKWTRFRNLREDTNILWTIIEDEYKKIIDSFLTEVSKQTGIDYKNFENSGWKNLKIFPNPNKLTDVKAEDLKSKDPIDCKVDYTEKIITECPELSDMAKNDGF